MRFSEGSHFPEITKSYGRKGTASSLCQSLHFLKHPFWETENGAVKQQFIKLRVSDQQKLGGLISSLLKGKQSPSACVESLYIAET